MGLDPLIRRYMSSTTLASSRICVLADDLRLVLASIRDQPPAVIELFRKHVGSRGGTHIVSGDVCAHSRAPRVSSQGF